MAVMAGEEWTDGRLDDLAKGMEKGFDRVDGDVREVRSEIRELRADTKRGFDEMNTRFDSLQRTMIAGFAGMIASTVAGVVGAVVATQV